MARPGPKPKPRELKLVTGNPGKRRIPETMMLPPSCPPEPDWTLLRVDPERASAFWRVMIPEFDKAGTLAAVDRRMVYDYVRCSVRLDECEADIELEGWSVPTAEGSVKLNPAVTAANGYRATIHKYEGELGVGAGNRATRQVPADAEPKRSVWTG